MLLTDEEKKKREEKAKLILSNNKIADDINSINYANLKNIKLDSNKEEEQVFVNKVKEANAIINSINPRQNVSEPVVSEQDRLKSQENVQKFINLLDGNVDNTQDMVLEDEASSNNIASEEQRNAVNVLINKNPIHTQDEVLSNIQNKEQEEKQWNPIENIKSFFTALLKGASSGGKQVAKYVESASEQNNDLYKNLKEKQFLTSVHVSEEDKASHKEASNVLLHNGNLSQLQLANRNVPDSGFLLKQPNSQSKETNLVKQGLQKSIEEDSLEIQNAIENTSDPVAKKLTQLAPSIGQMSVGWAASAVNPMLGISYFMTSAGGSYMDEAKQRGMQEEDAFTYGTIMGAMEGVTEEIGISKLMKGGKAFRKGMIKTALKEYGLNAGDNFIQEAIIEPISEATATIVGGKDKADWSDMQARMLQSGIDGALTSFIMDGVSLGMNSSIYVANKIQQGDKVSKVEIKKAIEDMASNKNEDMENKLKQEFDYQIDKLSNNASFTLTKYDKDNDYISMFEVQGQKLDRNIDGLDMIPAVVKVGNDYHVIDSATGLELYTTTNSNKQEVIKSFTTLVDSLDTAGMKNLHNQVLQTRMAIDSKMEQLQNNPALVQDFQIQNNEISYDKMSSTEQRFNDIQKLVSQISNNSIYNQVSAKKVFETIGNHIDTIEMTNQNGKTFINSLDKDGSVVFQQKLDGKVYTGAKIKDMMNLAIQKADLSNIYTPITSNKDVSKTSYDKNTSTFYSDEIENTFYKQIEEKKEINTKSITSKMKTDTKIKEPVILTNSQQTSSSTSKTLPDTEIRFAKKQVKLDGSKTNAERPDSYIEQEIQKIEKTGDWDNSIPVTKRTDIRKTIEDYLGLGVKKGMFKQHAYGIYKSNRDVIRTKELKDMDTIIHETGHALDLGNRLQIDKESISTELLHAIDKLGGYENESRTIRLEEGFAEIIRQYAIVPKQTKVEYPQTVLVLEKLRLSDKSFDTFISTVQKQIYNYIHQNPRNRTLSNVSIGEGSKKVPLTKQWLEQKVMRNIYDKDYATKFAVKELAKRKGKSIHELKASENAYFLVRLASGISDKVCSMLSDGYIDENGYKLMPGLHNIGEILDNNPTRFDDLRAYLIAKRDVDYKAKSLKTGIRSLDSKAVIKQFEHDVAIQKASKLVYDTLDGVLQYAVNHHLISKETADILKQSNAFYVPLQRVLNDGSNQVGRRGAVVDTLKKRTGSELDIKDVLENIIVNSSNMIQQVENNTILKAFYKQGEEVGLTGAIYDVIDSAKVKVGSSQLNIWETELRNQGVDTSNLDLEKTIDIFVPDNKIDLNNLVTSFINDDGKRVYLQFHDEILFYSLMNMDKQFMSKVLRINRFFNMPLRYGATMANLGFAIPNMISDTVQASIFSTAGFVPIVDNVFGVLDILATTNRSVKSFVHKVAPAYAEKINYVYSMYQQTGATSSSRLSQYRESSQNIMKNVYGTKGSEVLGIHERFKPLKRLLDILTYIPEISEQSTRFEVFKKNYNLLKEKGSSEMDARIEAALESRDATQDFGRTGNFMREINQLIPFSAARVGSLYTFSEKLQANPKRVTMRLAFLSALAMVIKGLGYDDDEIEELNQRKKDDNFVLKIGNEVVTIKKPQGVLRSMINLTEYIQDLATGHIQKGEEGKRLIQWTQNAIMDNMIADNATGLVPNMVIPLVENAINKDFYYHTEIVKSSDLELPDSEQYYDYNSQLAIWIGKVFNYAPAKIDNIISGYFAGVGTSTTSVMDYILGKMGFSTQQPEMGAEDNPIGKRFIVNVNSYSASLDEIYDKKTALMKKKNSNSLTDTELSELENITEGISNIAKLNKQIKEIKQNLSLSGKEKADKIKLLQQQRTDTARGALGKDLLYGSSASSLERTKFYPSRDVLTHNGYVLTLDADKKKEFEELASSKFEAYRKQNLYHKDYLEKLESKAKDYAKSQLIHKYKNELTKMK